MRWRRLTAASIAVVGLFAGSAVASGKATAGDEARNCAWTVKVDPDGVNALYPDQFARYWVLHLPAAPGSSLLIRGYYPHARYTSLTSYDEALRSVGGLPDVAIRPDRGSTNPFRVGAHRNTALTHRHYTVHVVLGRVPSHPAHNTLYTTSADGSRQAVSFLVALRIYEPDRGLPDDGGVPLPSVTVVTPAGSRTLPDCSLPDPPGGTNAAVAGTSAPYTGTASSTPIVWHKFYNLPGAVTANLAPGANGAARTLPKGGFLDNPDNNYISAVVETLRAPAIVITGRLPSTPDTYPHARRMPHAQLRYWSMCSNELASERFYGCVMDDQLPLRHGRRFTIVVTTAPDTVLIERNMLPAPSFRHSIQAARYDHEQADLGRYYPAARYATLQQVRSLGCHTPAVSGRR